MNHLANQLLFKVSHLVLSLPLVRDLLSAMVDSKHTCFVDVPWCVEAGGGAFVDHDVPQKVSFCGDDFYFRSVFPSY